MAGHYQNQHPNACRHASSGYFGSKFVTVCVTGEHVTYLKTILPFAEDSRRTNTKALITRLSKNEIAVFWVRVCLFVRFQFYKKQS